MDTRLAGDGAGAKSGLINLARIAPFELGAVRVVPATLQVGRGARHETVEPRVMQVLVALWRANGAVVTRDDLIASCWDGRIVGDNAIHRTISRLRDIAGDIGFACFRVETVSKVGYRLVILETQAVDEAAAPAVHGQRRLWIAVAAGMLAAVIAGAAAWIVYPASDAPRVVVIAARASDAREFAAGVAVDLAHLADVHGNAVTFAAGADSRSNAYLLEVAARASQADITLRRAASPDIIWSASFMQHDGDLVALRQQVTNAASSAIDCALHAHGNPAHSSSDQLRALFVACDGLGDYIDEERVAAWQRAVATNPDNAALPATLSYVEAELRDSNIYLDRAGKERTGAEDRLRAALAGGKDFAMTYAAEALRVPNSRFSEKLAIVNRGLGRDPHCAILHDLEFQALRNVGLTEEALDSARRAVALAPDSPAAREALISGLAYGGFTQEARAELAVAQRIWPNSRAILDAGSRFEFRYGDAAALVRQIEIGKALPNSPWNIQQGPERYFLLARAQPTQANIDASIAFSVRDTYSPTMSLQNLVSLGRVDLAYDLPNRPGVVDFLRDQTEILFRAHMRPFVLDHRFMRLADRLGLVRFWVESGTWPDFCRDRDLSYDCKAEAQHLHPDRT